MTLEPGSLIGDYRILAPVGAGAYGEVFQAEHVITQRIDALKIQRRHRPGDAEEEQRFLREIQVQASLDHPNIAAVHNAFWAPVGLVLVMELIQGEPLSAILGRGRLPLHEGAGYVLAMLSGLRYAHAHGVIHRDIKPENVVVGPRGSVKLTDFGLARSLSSPRQTQTGQFAGSPCYMSPEQILGNLAADARSDIYSTGVVLYEVVTGHPPFQGESGFEIMTAQQSALPVPPAEIEPSAGPQLSCVILTALEKLPSRRYQTAEEFQTAIERALLPARSAPQPAPRLRPALVLAGISIAVCAAAVYVTVFAGAPQGAAANRPAYVSAPMVVERPAPPQALRAAPAPAPPLAAPTVRVKPRLPHKPRPYQVVPPAGATPLAAAPVPAEPPEPSAPQPLVRAPHAIQGIAPPVAAPAAPDSAPGPAAALGETSGAPPARKPHAVWRALRKVLGLPPRTQPPQP